MRKLCLPVLLIALSGAAAAQAPDRAAAFAQRRQAAEAGDAASMRYMAMAYRYGRGVPADMYASAHWLKLAAGSGDTRSMAELGIAYLNGIGVDADDSAAVGWFRRAMAGGDVMATARLAWCMETGHGTAQDDAMAATLHARAAAAGERFSRERLVLMLEDGRGVPAQPARAAALLADMEADKDVSGLADLATLYQQRHQVAKAQATFDAALRLERAGIDADTAIGLLNSYGAFCIDNSKFDDARDAYTRALARMADSGGPNTLARVDTLDRLGYLAMVAIRTNEAIALFERSLASRREHGLDIYPPLMQLGSLAALQERYQDAARHYSDARNYLYVAYPPGHPAFALNDMRRAALHTMQGDYPAALPLLGEALRVQQAQPKRDDAQIIDTLSELGTAYYNLGRLDEAAGGMQRALTLAQQLYGPSHHRVATGLNNLGVMELARGHLDAAEPLLRQGLAMRVNLLGPDHADCAISLMALGGLAQQRGQFDAAEGFWLRAIAINEAALGPAHSNVAGNLDALGSMYVEQKRYDRAAPVLARAWTIQRDGPESISKKRASAERLASVYRNLQREPEAAALAIWLAANQ